MLAGGPTHPLMSKQAIQLTENMLSVEPTLVKIWTGRLKLLTQPPHPTHPLVTKQAIQLNENFLSGLVWEGEDGRGHH